MADTAEKVTHSPLPWFASPVQLADDGWEFATIGPFDVTGQPFEHHVEETICEVSGINHNCGANAEFIVKAVNHHEDLLAIAQIVDADVRGGEPCTICSESPHRHDCFLAALLAKVSAK